MYLLLRPANESPLLRKNVGQHFERLKARASEEQGVDGVDAVRAESPDQQARILMKIVSVEQWVASPPWKSVVLEPQVFMIIGIGTDLAEVSRVRDSVSRFGDRFLGRVYTAGERAYALSKANAAERLAARFAAKEAGMKALGTGWSRGVRWQDIEVFNEQSGRPTLRLYGAALRVSESLGVKRTTVSLTHTADIAFAVVILEDGN